MRVFHPSARVLPAVSACCTPQAVWAAEREQLIAEARTLQTEQQATQRALQQHEASVAEQARLNGIPT